jgi:hypothetical protein
MEEQDSYAYRVCTFRLLQANSLPSLQGPVGVVQAVSDKEVMVFSSRAVGCGMRVCAFFPCRGSALPSILYAWRHGRSRETLIQRDAAHWAL